MTERPQPLDNPLIRGALESRTRLQLESEAEKSLPDFKDNLDRFIFSHKKPNNNSRRNGYRGIKLECSIPVGDDGFVSINLIRHESEGYSGYRSYEIDFIDSNEVLRVGKDSAFIESKHRLRAPTPRQSMQDIGPVSSRKILPEELEQYSELIEILQISDNVEIKASHIE